MPLRKLNFMNNLFKKIRQILSFLTPRIRVTKAKTWQMRLTLIGFYLLLGFVVINVVIKSVYFYDNTYQYRIFNHNYIAAILPEQPLNQPLQTQIVRLKNPNKTPLHSNDYLIINDHDNGLLSLSESFPLIVLVVAADENREVFEVSYDGTTTTEIASNQVIGIYQKEANFFGIYYYISTFPLGYYSLMFSHIMLLTGYYYILIYDNPRRFLPNKQKHPSKSS